MINPLSCMPLLAKNGLRVTLLLPQLCLLFCSCSLHGDTVVKKGVVTHRERGCCCCCCHISDSRVIASAKAFKGVVFPTSPQQVGRGGHLSEKSESTKGMYGICVQDAYVGAPAPPPPAVAQQSTLPCSGACRCHPFHAVEKHRICFVDAKEIVGVVGRREMAGNKRIVIRGVTNNDLRGPVKVGILAVEKGERSIWDGEQSVAGHGSWEGLRLHPAPVRAS